MDGHEVAIQTERKALTRGAAPLAPETMIAVLLGASEYPGHKEWSNPVLGASARAVRDYLVARGGLGLAPGNVLDLFDDAAATADQLLRVADFLRAAPDASGLSGRKLGDWNARVEIGEARPPVDLTARRFYGKDDWKKSTRDKLKRHFGGKPRPPRVVTGAIASSDRLIKDDEILAVWLKITRQVVAVEMESAGIYKATQERNVPFLAIRGISDVVGYQRDPDWTGYACETAAAFARALLLTRPIAPIAPG